MALLAQISDLHLDGTARTTARATRTIRYLRSLPQPPDALLVTGDIADTAAITEYEEAASLLDLPFPAFTAPGNHDRRSAYRTALLGEPAGDDPINRAHEVAGVTVLMCDSTIPDQDDGLLDPATLHWIDAELTARGELPALLAFHHPPATMHHPLLDSCRLAGLPDLEAVLSRHPQVIALITGHAHSAAATTFASRPVIVGPATTWTLQLPWEGPEHTDPDQPPGLAFHVVDQHQLITHFRVVP